MSENKKLKLAVYWASACGGCDVAITHLHEKVLDLAAAADILFWPCAMDFKYKDVEEMPDGHIDVCIFSGAIRTSEHEHFAKLLRQKSKVMAAYGACSCMGGIPGLSNVTTAVESMSRACLESPSTLNKDRTLPALSADVPEGTLTLPVIWDTVKSLRQVIDVEYFIPGCPPSPEITWAAIEAIVSGKLPAPGSVIGGNKSVCDECKLEKKNEMRVGEIKRMWQIKPDTSQCLMEQGLVCIGPATRGGCGALCTNVMMPCRGCYGPVEGVDDFGAAMLSALASVIDSNDEKRIAEVVDSVPDPIGTFYRFSLPESTLRRRKIAKEGV
ncbi:MAG: oxidoreductase [bacterium]